MRQLIVLWEPAPGDPLEQLDTTGKELQRVAHAEYGPSVAVASVMLQRDRWDDFISRCDGCRISNPAELCDLPEGTPGVISPAELMTFEVAK